MYFNKFSSGTILALLALSGMLFLVPFAVPAHAAQNASLPTIKTTPTLVLQETPTALKEAVTNPASNAYSITSVTFIAPSGWNFTDANNVALTGAGALAFCTAGGWFSTIAVSTTAIQCSGGTGLPPGFTATLTGGSVSIQGPASPKAAAPVTGSFTTSVADASGLGAYPGPSWTETSIAGSGVLVSPAHTGEVPPTITITGNPTTYTAGAAPVTVTATLTAPSQPGVPLGFSAANGAYPTSGFTTTFTPSSGVTSATGVLTTSWQPSNWAGDNTAVKGTITGALAASIPSGTGAQVTTTGAGSPTKVTFYLPASPTIFPATHYVTGFVVITATNYADIAAAGISFSATDAFGNPAGAAVTGGTITAANGFFYETPATTTCAVTLGGGLCQYNVGTSTGLVPEYSQSGTYASIGQISATLTGGAGASAFSVSGTTGFIQTSTFAASASFQGNEPVGGAIASGSTVGYKVNLNVAQTGVPVKLQVCVHSACAATSKGYSGTFSNGQSSISGVTNSSGSFASVFTISNKLNAAVVMNASISAPVDVAANPQSFYSAVSPTVTTTFGAAAKFAVYAAFGNGQGSGNSGPATNFATAGATVYVDILLTDAYGNVVNNPSPQQIQIQLTTSGVGTPAGGLLSVTTDYIAGGTQSTNNTGAGSFGPDAWTLSTTLGASTVTAVGVVNGVQVTGSDTVTTVSSAPTINVKAPTPVSGVIYSSSPFVTFSGKANASVGYPGSVTVNSIGYKVNSNPWVKTSASMLNKVVWSIPVTLATGLSTVSFNATDSKSNVGITTPASFQVLVDSAAPTFAFSTASSNNGCVAVTVSSAAGDFNTASFAATYNSVAVPAASISWTGTQTLGSPSTLTANVCGLVSQTATFAVSGSNFTGVSGSNSESLTVTVPFANSITFNTGTATYGLNGAFKGVTVTVTNGWNTAQTIVVYATLKSGSSIYVADGTVTVGSGQSATVFCIDLQTIPAGSYSVTFAAVTVANQAVSAPTTPITLAAT